MTQKQIMYKAQDNNGKLVYDYIEANTNKELVQKLKAKGYTHIEYYDNVAFIEVDKGLENHTSKQLAIQAKLNITMLLQPNFWSYLLGSIRLVPANKVILLIAMILCLVGGYYHYFFMLFGTVLILYILYIIWTDYMYYDDINHMNQAYVNGDLDGVMHIIDRYKHESVELEDAHIILFDTMQAHIDAHRISSKDAYDVISQKYIQIKEISPIDYTFILYGVSLMHHQYEKGITLLESLQKQHANKDIIPLMLLSLQLHIGTEVDAEAILESIEVENLELLYTRALYYNIKGNIHKEDKVLALEYFTKAKEIFDIKNLNPAYAMQAMYMRASYAYALCLNDRKDEAKKILKQEWKIISAHDTEYKEKILKCFPEFKNRG